MTYQDEERYRKTFNIRRCEKCCGNCKHFERDYECAGCAHPKQRIFNSFLKAMQDSDPEYSETYGAYGGIDVDEGNVCDLWEGKEGGKDD